MGRPASSDFRTCREQESGLNLVEYDYFGVGEDLERRGLAGFIRQANELVVGHRAKISSGERGRAERDYLGAKSICAAWTVAGDHALVLERANQSENGSLAESSRSAQLGDAVSVRRAPKGLEHLDRADDRPRSGQWTNIGTLFHKLWQRCFRWSGLSSRGFPAMSACWLVKSRAAACFKCKAANRFGAV